MIGTASRIALILALAFGLGLAPAWAGPTLDKIKQAGTVVCGVSTGVPGFSQPDSQGRYSGLDVDAYRAKRLQAMVDLLRHFQLARPPVLDRD